VQYLAPSDQVTGAKCKQALEAGLRRLRLEKGVVCMSDMPRVSNAFQTFMKEAPAQQQIWLDAAKKLGAVSALDAKTEELVYIGILAAARLESGLPFHVTHAKSLGATRDEIISAILAGLPAVGNVVIQALPVALDAYDEG
jgi:alkylhydroperoxidase/carboxymuconolactone decarboxylase family protein YurZ